MRFSFLAEAEEVSGPTMRGGCLTEASLLLLLLGSVVLILWMEDKIRCIDCDYGCVTVKRG